MKLTNIEASIPSLLMKDPLSKVDYHPLLNIQQISTMNHDEIESQNTNTERTPQTIEEIEKELRTFYSSLSSSHTSSRKNKRILQSLNKDI